MSCPLSLRVSNEPIEYVYGNTYEHIPHDKADKTKEGKILEHRWKLYLKVLKGDPNYMAFKKRNSNNPKDQPDSLIFKRFSLPKSDHQFGQKLERTKILGSRRRQRVQHRV